MSGKRAYIILFTTVLAILLWISVQLGYEYQIAVNVPIAFENVRPGAAIRTPVPRTLEVHLQGGGWQLAPLFLAQKLYYVHNMQGHRDDHVITVNNVAGNIALPAGVTLAAMFPDSVVVTLGEFAQKKVPLTPAVTLQYHDGYGQVGDISIKPDSIVIGGAADVIARVDRWWTEHFAFTDVRASIEVNVPVADTGTYRLAFTPSHTQVSVNVQPLAERTIAGVRVEVDGVPPNLEVVMIPPKMDLVIRSGIERLRTVVPGDFRISTSYNHLIADSSGMLVPAITGPPDVNVVSKKPDRLQFVIRKRL